MTGSDLSFKKILLAAEQSLELRSGRSRSLESSEEPAIMKAERMVAGDEDFPLSHSWPLVHTPNHNHMIIYFSNISLL